jgi:hypothetical protein
MNPGARALKPVKCSASRVARLALLMSNALFITVLLLAAPAAQAWGCKGHQTVAFIAEKYLTPEAKDLVQSLLSENPIDPKVNRYCGSAVKDLMADSSTWPDDVRSDRKNGPWHYIDIPRGAARSPIVEYCGEAGCVTRAIGEQVAILRDRKADAIKRAEAVRYIIHFVGDLHQPLHGTTNADQGGNCVPVNYLRRTAHEHGHNFSPNLHSLWDTAIPERDMEGADPAEYAGVLEAAFAKNIESWQAQGIYLDDWAWESHSLAEAVAYGGLQPTIAVEPNVPVHTCADDNNIGERLLAQHIVAGQTYQEKAAKVAEERLTQAGVRLAMILNDAARR